MSRFVGGVRALSLASLFALTRVGCVGCVGCVEEVPTATDSFGGMVRAFLGREPNNTAYFAYLREGSGPKK